MTELELEEHYLDKYGKVVFKHKTNKDHFIERAYYWKDRCIMLYEHIQKDNTTIAGEYMARTLLDSYQFSTYDFGAWEPMTKQEYDSVKRTYTEIYN